MSAEAHTQERLARLEEGYAHLATKADLEGVRGELKADLERLAGSFKVWIIVAAIVQAFISAILSLALRAVG